jgi:hypothetical protein
MRGGDRAGSERSIDAILTDGCSTSREKQGKWRLHLSAEGSKYGQPRI